MALKERVVEKPRSSDQKTETYCVDGSSIESGSVITTGESEVHRTGSTFGAFLNIVCVVIGTGSLQLPYSIKQSGWIGLLFILASGFIGVFTGNLIIRCLYLKSGGRLKNFSDIGQAAFGRLGRYFCQFFNLIYIAGIVCVYIILAGSNINNLMEDAGVHVNSKVWMFISAVVMWVPFVAVKYMSEAAVLAFFGFATSAVVTMIAVIQSIRRPYTKAGSIPFEHHAVSHDVVIPSGMPIAMSSITFAFCGVAIYPHVEASMKKPEKWPHVMILSMVVIVATYMFVGIAGYWAFGDQSVSPILENLPNDSIRKAAEVLITLHVIFAAPIMMTSLALEIETSFKITKERLGRSKEFLYRFLIRTGLTIVLLCISIAIPFFGDVLNLVGALSTTVIFCVIPVLCYISLKGWRSFNWYTWIAFVVVLLIGVLSCILGSIDAIRALVKDIKA